MKRTEFCKTEIIETSGVFEFPDGPVNVSEREIHGLYRLGHLVKTRLVIGDAIERTRGFIAKARAEFSELNSLMRELTAK